jgi:drug/metabolite transporter (DMT)-like permease
VHAPRPATIPVSPSAWTVWAPFVGLVIIWSLAWPVSKLALIYAPPLLFAGLRVFSSGLVLMFVVAFILHKRPTRRQWRLNALLSLFNVSLFYGVQNIALAHLPAGLLSILVYTQPIFTALLARWWLAESLTGTKMIGIGLGFGGVLAISLQGLTGATAVTSIGLGILSGLSWALGTVFYKRYSVPPDPLLDMSIELTLGGAVLLIWGSLAEPWSQMHWTLALGAAWGYTAIFGTAIAWALWAHLLRQGDASRVASWTFLVPVLSTVMSVVWLGEHDSPWLWLGAVLVVCGTILVNRRSKPSLGDLRNR